MSDTQLREAYALMKQGNKAGASRLVQDILRQDKSNPNAWWLFSHLLEDEEKIVKSLEKVLALDPDHVGARKKLASMRPEYAHLAPSDETAKAKKKTEQQSDGYWDKLNNEQQIREKAYLQHLKDTDPTRMRLKVMLVVLPIFLFIVGIAYLQSQQSLPDKNGETPQNVAARIIVAFYQHDNETLYATHCPAIYDDVDEAIARFDPSIPSPVIVDTSGMEFELADYQDKLAYVRFHGIITVQYGEDGTVYTLDQDKKAQDNDIGAYGMYFHRIEGIWYACTSYDVPRLN